MGTIIIEELDAGSFWGIVQKVEKWLAGDFF